MQSLCFSLTISALGKNIPEKVASVVEGVAEGCVQSGCALIGGETAEMPGFYPADEYDLAGFAVGIVDRSKVFDVETQRPGDVIIALAVKRGSFQRLLPCAQGFQPQFKQCRARNPC